MNSTKTTKDKRGISMQKYVAMVMRLMEEGMSQDHAVDLVATTYLVSSKKLYIYMEEVLDG